MVANAQEPIQDNDLDRRCLPRWPTNLHALWKKTDDQTIKSDLLGSDRRER